MDSDQDKIFRLIKDLYKGEDFISLHRPIFDNEEKNILEETIESNFVSSVGKKVDEFEKILATFTGARFAVVTMNGTAALHVSLHANGIDRNSEVITQAMTFVATANSIKYTGADVSFIDVDPKTLGMSADSLKDYLSKFSENKNGKIVNKITGKEIKACIPMHTFGFPCNAKEILEICKENNIIMIEDCAESLGSFIGAKHTGTFGQCGTLSFNGNKIITTGGGGAVFTDSEELAKKIKHLTTTAKKSHPYEYFHDELGFNYRLPNINAALGCVQMKKIQKFLKNKRQTHEIYKELIESLKKDVEIFSENDGTTANYWLNALFLKDKRSRDRFIQDANDQKIMVRPIWYLMNTLPMYKDSIKTSLKNSEAIYERVVNIPSSVRNT